MVRTHNAQRIRLYEFLHIIPHGLACKVIIEAVFIACDTHLLVAAAWSQSGVWYVCTMQTVFAWYSRPCENLRTNYQHPEWLCCQWKVTHILLPDSCVRNLGDDT